MRGTERTDAMINGALMAGGLIAILDNVVAHWILQLHRAIPGPHPEPVEAALVVLGAVLLVVGVWRERRARAA
jgi:uncharacterized membrane protein